MNKDVEILLQAILMTEKKYGKGTTKWIDYLYHGDVSCFTSTGGARDLISPIYHRQLLKHVLAGIFWQLRSYLEKEPYYSDNEVANYIIKWIHKKCFINFEESYDCLKNLYHEFLKDFENYEKRFDNHAIVEILEGNFGKSIHLKQQLENTSKMITILSKLILVAEDRKEEVMVEINQSDLVCNKPLIRRTFLDCDLENFMKAIEITEKKFGPGKGRVSFFQYLENGDVSIFSSRDGARDFLSSLDYKIVCQKVVLTMLQNIMAYFETVIPFQTPSNPVVINFIDRVNWEFENSEQLNQIYDEVIDNLFSNGKRNAETIAYSLDILAGNISQNMKSLPRPELDIQRERTCSYLKQLIYYTEECLSDLQKSEVKL